MKTANRIVVGESRKDTLNLFSVELHESKSEPSNRELSLYLLMDLDRTDSVCSNFPEGAAGHG